MRQKVAFASVEVDNVWFLMTNSSSGLFGRLLKIKQNLPLLQRAVIGVGV